MAVLMGVACAMPTMADAATSRGARETVKQRVATEVSSTSRSVKLQGTKQPLRSSVTRGAAVSRFASISCVPYVRSITGMDITGNAHTWWARAAGNYARGQRPERGAVMSFRASGGMRLGHVAVVSKVVGAREVLIDHANWEGPGIRKGTVMHGVSVIDVSDRNDWTAVRVQVGRSDEAYGRVYPLHGFIYNRPDNGRLMMAGTGASFEELAEAPSSPHAAHLAEAVSDLNLGGGRR
ncbi:CHAP domain-containing protein [Roseomonas marmotae]|uniref:CHAP domain-containing protein n=1 Tax=Roseomonas marmotae TaxID=2768161 RepID=UPI001F35F8ED|nr:CHAP domain-containing protein [Roseomonas marmotae]